MPEYRQLAWKQLPRIVDHNEPIGALLPPAEALEAGIDPRQRPLIFPTSDDQAAGLVGGGAVDAGQMAIVLGNSAVVNSSSSKLPSSGALDAMRLNWGPYLWMRCYNNGGAIPRPRRRCHVPTGKPWSAAARLCLPASDGTRCCRSLRRSRRWA